MMRCPGFLAGSRQRRTRSSAASPITPTSRPADGSSPTTQERQSARSAMRLAAHARYATTATTLPALIWIVVAALLIVVTILQKNIPNLPAGLFADTPDRVVVVDTGNYYPRQRDGRINAIEAGLSESRWVEQQIGRPVIKAFNNIYARHLFELGRSAGAPGRIALPVAGDDDAAKTVVLKLVEELGFDGVDAGGLDESWRQQPGTPVYTKDFDADGVRRGLYEASKDRTPEWRGTSNSPGSFSAPA